MRRRRTGAASSDSEALATFGATGVQHGAAGAGGHAGAEAMSALAADNRGLKSTFHRGLARLLGAKFRANPMPDWQHEPLFGSCCTCAAADCAEPWIRQQNVYICQSLKLLAKTPLRTITDGLSEPTKSLISLWITSAGSGKMAADSDRTG
jgi:hypothetical protein